MKQTFLENLCRPIRFSTLAALVSLLIGEYTTRMQPTVVSRSEEHHREFTNIMCQFLYTDWNLVRKAHFSWPPPQETEKIMKICDFETYLHRGCPSRRYCSVRSLGIFALSKQFDNFQRDSTLLNQVNLGKLFTSSPSRNHLGN